MLSLRTPSPAVVDALLHEQQDEPFSYPEVGGTDGTFPDDYQHVRHEVDLGHGPEVFDRAVDGLRRWQAHVRAGVAVRPPHALVQEGLTVALTVPVAGLYVSVACRVVYVVEQLGRWGFAYGTLPHHMVEGAEAFIVEGDEADTVRFGVSAFSRPRGPVSRALTPAVRVLDHRIARRYLRGLQQHVAERA